MKKTSRFSAWKITYNNFRPKDEKLREALLTLGNGYFGTRGAALEAKASDTHYPGTYIAGVFNQAPTLISGRTIINEDFVNCPNWLPIIFKIPNSNWINPLNCKIISYNQELDLKLGALSRKIKFKTSEGLIFTILEKRLVSMANYHLGAISYRVRSSNYIGNLIIRAGIDASVENTGVPRYSQLNSKHHKITLLEKINQNTIKLAVKTLESKITIALIQRLRLFSYVGADHLCPKGYDLPATKFRTIKENKGIYQECSIRLRKNKPVTLEKTVLIYTSHVRGNPPKANAASNVASRFVTIFNKHKKAWQDLWNSFDIEIVGDEQSQKALRFHAFHLLQTASHHNKIIDAGLGARGLHGEAYRGHIFWDDLFVFPFYNLHAPDITRAILMYRYRRLDQARKLAKEEGYKGAMFPWQSGAYGDEQTQKIHLNPKNGKWGPDHSHNQRHVSLAIAYSFWRYFKESADLDFLINHGAEVILSITQFISSLAKFDPKTKKFHIKGVMGPDEFHEKLPSSKTYGLSDNAYTNIMSALTFYNALELLKIIPEKTKVKLLKKLKIDKYELARWEKINRNINVIINNSGILSQFKGYFDLKELDMIKYAKKHNDIHRMDRILKAEGKLPDDYKILKQADVLMLFYLFPLNRIKATLNNLGYEFNNKILKKNFDYYMARTSHGSTLSLVVHGYLAHILAQTDLAWKFYQKVLDSDLNDIQGGTTREGIHTGVMGGSLDFAMRGFLGIDALGHVLKIHPKLPKAWKKVNLKLLFRKNLIVLSITKNKINLTLAKKQKASPLEVMVYNKPYWLKPGKTYVIKL